MNQREKLLVVIVGSAGGLLALLIVWTSISTMYATRRGTLATLEKAVADQQRIERQTTAAVYRMKEYQARSLPPVPSVARSVYQTWLLEQFDKAGVRQPQVTVAKPKEDRKLATSQNFILTSQGTLPQAVKLLHNFHSGDYLHRINRLNIKPIKDSKQLDLTLEVEAVSLLQAPASSTLKERVATRLSLGKPEDYVRIISERNLFGEANHAPAISGLGQQKAIRGQRAEFTPRGTDPDKLDKLTYSLVKSGASDARLDKSTGRISWTPRSNGKVEFLVRATDDGWPALSSKDERLVVTVEDPPPPPPEPPRRLAFDDAKFTVLSAVIDVGGIGQVWLNVRPKGQTLKLGVGDKFEIGSVKGIVTAIGAGDFTFESEGRELKLFKGSTLEQAISVPQ